MPNASSIFADEWRECLRAHYMTVIRNNDKITEKTLNGVMHEAGFTDPELGELKVRATMHMDHVDADFLPDMSILEAEPVIVQGIAIAVPQQVIEAAIVEESLALDEANSAADMEETVADLEETVTDAGDEDETVSEADDEPPVDPDITQMSLF